MGHSPDPLEIHVAMPDFVDEGEPPTWSLSLETLIRDSLDIHTSPRTGLVDDPEGIAVAKGFADAFRRLADLCDAAQREGAQTQATGPLPIPG
jgi:hypothetical protein